MNQKSSQQKKPKSIYIPSWSLGWFFITHVTLIGKNQSNKKKGIAIEATTKNEEEIDGDDHKKIEMFIYKNQVGEEENRESKGIL